MAVEKHIDEFVAQARRIGKERLQLCSSGNLSWRAEEDIALISGTGAWLSRLAKEDTAVCEISTGNRLSGARPSMESGFHLGILREREEVNVVFHFQSEFATAVACMKNKPVNFNILAEIPCYCGEDIPVIPYFLPGSPELAQAVVETLKNHDVAILNKHGQVACGKDFDDVLQKALFFEMACRIIVCAGEGNYETLTNEGVKALRAIRMRKGR